MYVSRTVFRDINELVFPTPPSPWSRANKNKFFHRKFG